MKICLISSKISLQLGDFRIRLQLECYNLEKKETLNICVTKEDI